MAAVIEAQTRRFRTRDGLTIVADEAGPADGPVVLFLHGGGQTRQSWGRAVTLLGGAGFHAITLDLRGHGESDWAPDGRYGPLLIQEDILDIAAQLPGRPALVGASLGGLAALLAAGVEGDPVARALVLVDVVPQIETAGGEEVRAFMTGNPQGFASVDEAADAVAAYIPHRPRPRDTSGLMRNLRLRDDGRYHWHWDPAMMSGVGRINPGEHLAALEAAASRVAMPTMLVRGGRSRVVSMEGVRAFQSLIPHAEFVNIDEADHMVAGDANDAFNAPLLDFLERSRST